MARDFTGSNQCNLLVPHGQFGTRFAPDDCGSPRYLHTEGSAWLESIFSHLDKLTFNTSDEGDNIEPTVLYPIVPI